MDLLLSKVTQQAMNYAIRSGVTLTATYAIKQSTKLLQASPKSNVRDELLSLQQRLEHKIRIISPAIDMIELIAARGNTSLESAVTLTKELRYDIQTLGQRLAAAASSSVESGARTAKTNSEAREQNEMELRIIVVDVKRLLTRIEDAVPLINLAITTSGATLSTKLPSTVSPSRLLQASTFLTAGDTQYAATPNQAVQVGPTFVLSVYMLFAGHNRPENEDDIRNTTWQEVIHKARVKLRRVPVEVIIDTGSGSEAKPSVEITASGTDSNAEEDSRIPAHARADEYAYQLMIIEDFDDDRVHDFSDQEAKPGRFDDVRLAGIREMVPIHELSKIFYADTSKVLNIAPESETNSPVLLLKRDVNAILPRKMAERDGMMRDPHDHDHEHTEDHSERQDRQHVQDEFEDRADDPWRLPKSLDPEWIAFEVYTEQPSSDTESDSDLEFQTPAVEVALSQLNLSPSSTITQNLSSSAMSQLHTVAPPPWTNMIRTSLSMLELLLRLTSLQQFQQASHLSITDELLNFFLEESASTGAGGDEHHRQAVRADARRKVGWDPYDESPLKRRGEEYQYHGPGDTSSQYGGSQYSGGGAYSREGPPSSYAPTPLRSSYAPTRHEPSSNSPNGYNVTSPPPSNTGIDISDIYGTSSTPNRNIPNHPQSIANYPPPSPISPNVRHNTPNTMSPSSPSAALDKSRPQFVKRQGGAQVERLGSPLRQERSRSRLSDEGIGTSPASDGSGMPESRGMGSV